MQKIPILIAMLLALTLTPIVSSADGSKRVIDVHKDSIKDLENARQELESARAEIQTLHQQVAKDAKKIDNLRQSARKTDRQIKALVEQMAKLTDAVSVSNGKVGIGTTSPRVKLDINGDVKAKNSLSITGSIFPHVEIVNYTGIGGQEPILIMKNYGGTHKAPKATKKGTLGTIIYGGHNGEEEVQSARIAVRSTGNFSPWNHPVRMDFQVGGDTPCCGIRRMSIDGKSGNVGIGTKNPQYKLHVAGKIKGELVSPSDQRHKQNIQTLDGSLAKLAQLRGVRFNWKEDTEEKQIGLVAQEVEKVFPELVSTDSEGYKSIAYGKLTAVLIEAVKELQQSCQE
ncbi:tail fiber domain-containing protein [Candidatus Marithioploca araucensis]|uniref:Tail fiber domain-containing protein n=1 Tax=Candidatus Marithioploca araucensis TaxID=70273 RepID=A0ABT7VRA5_9GAMM|nr:tail fiber domain-containing protein [Candidatus Marithioploca araucensis]